MEEEMEAMNVFQIEPSTNNYIMPSLGLNNGWFMFSSVSSFLSSITPNDMPLIYCILELLRDAFQSKVSILRIILEALKMESGFICLILLIFIISVIPFGYTIAWFCSRNVRIKSRLVSDMSRNDALFQNECKQKIEKFHCQKKVFVVILQFLVTFSVIVIFGMFIVNEQISASINDTPTVLRSALKDSEFFVKSSNHELQIETFDQFDRMREKIKVDLEDIDKLLGERITREISVQTGLDLTFELTAEILESTRNLSARVQHLLNEVVLKTLLLATDAASKIDEIHTQLSVLQRQCSYRDRPLCDTLKVKSFDEMGFIENLKILNYNTILQKLRSMNDHNHDNNLKKMTEELFLSKKIFRNYSHQLHQDSKKQGEEILKQLSIMRGGINEALNKLSLVIKHVLDRIGNAWQKILPMIDNFEEAGYISWFVGLTSCATAIVVTMFLVVPLSFSCCHVDNLAGITFQMAAWILSIFSIGLGFFTIFEVLIGGHGEVFVCRAMYEKPEYTVIGRFFDTSNKSAKKGIFEELLISEGKSFANTTTLTNALGECELDKSAYYTFQIDHLLDLKNILNYENYPDVVTAINDMNASEAPFKSFTQKLQFLLSDLMNDADANFTKFRNEISQISPEKELTNFIDQLQRVSLQISDTTTASRMGSLVTAARRIQGSLLQPLEILKNEIVYQLTALELQIEPWMFRIMDMQVTYNQSQIYLDRNSFEVCNNFSENFRQRLRVHLDVFRNETLENFNKDFGCRSLFDTFDGIRLLTCQHIIEPINGLFFMSFVVLILWVVTTPISLLLASAYGKIEDIQNRLYNVNTIQSFEESMPEQEVQQQQFDEESPPDTPQTSQVTWSSRWRQFS